MENKQHICDLLVPVLQATRNLEDLGGLIYEKNGEWETVTAIFENGSTKKANVSTDSGTSMIRDIIGQIV